MYPILEAKKLADKIYLMVVKAPRISANCKPGEFVIVKIDEKGERIPLTICDYDREKETITIVFQTVGASTERMSTLQVGDSFRDVVGPLGNPSDFVKEDIEELKKKKYLFVAGGVGTAPVYPQVKWLKELVNEQGKKYDVCVAIGPMIMMKFVCLLTKELEIPTVVSLNPIMVDGTGMCGACRVTVDGKVKFACVDGPEFDGHAVNFDEAMKRQQMYKTEEGRALLKLREGETHHGGCGNCGND